MDGNSSREGRLIGGVVSTEWEKDFLTEWGTLTDEHLGHLASMDNLPVAEAPIEEQVQNPVEVAEAENSIQIQEQVQNFVEKAESSVRRELFELGPEDVQNLSKYFKKTQAKIPSFFYAIQNEQCNHMTNIMWADASARMAYCYFGDAVTFSIKYLHDRGMVPIVTFSGLNHHRQRIIFGCGLMADDSHASYVWLFESWLTAMGGKHPISLVTELGEAMASAIIKVFPNTSHCICKSYVLSAIEKEFSGTYKAYPEFGSELRKCIDESKTREAFESCWKSILQKYAFGYNEVLQSLYDICRQWVPCYLTADISLAHRVECVDKIIELSCSAGTPLEKVVGGLAQGLASCYEQEAHADFETMNNIPTLITASPIEKQAAGMYTRIVFEKFQKEFAESLGYKAELFENGIVRKYLVKNYEDAHDTYTVTLNTLAEKTKCSCHMFETFGILCRHVLKVFLVAGVGKIPKRYILRRWTRNGRTIELRGNSEEEEPSRGNSEE